VCSTWNPPKLLESSDRHLRTSAGAFGAAHANGGEFEQNRQ
jgi:hypothetical protein